eukprot:scaffold22620_cov131-Cylindrotheca_fusiformis.AAC.21
MADSANPAASSSVDEKLNLLLSSPNFSVSSYLNLALQQESRNSEDLQRRMAELALHLQIQTQSCHEDIGRIGAELQAILPRCAADVGRVGVGLEGIKLDAQTLLDTACVDSEEEGLSGSLETLSTLHALQSNLSRTKEILTAAATWDSTISSIPPLLAQQNLTEAVDALAQLEHGERALKGMPERQERQNAIAKIRAQVQVLLQPQLNHALKHMNSRLGPLQQCVALYAKLGKMDSLQEEYVKNRPGEVHKAWFSFAPSVDSKTDNVTNPSEFSTWLPSWYDTILSLLAEERRQSSTVFGAELAPEVLVMVLRECFRPILPSFQSRLESIFPSNASLSTKGSFETICAAYESTLRFLSLAYELIASSYLDVVESSGGSLKKGNDANLYTSMLQVCLQVAKPFANYMHQFDALEVRHLQMATQLVTKDIRQSVGSVSVQGGLGSLQDAIERLKDLAPFIFPMTKGSLDRFELLNGGYRAGESLSAVDKVLTDHVGELGIAIQTLSASLTMDIDQLADVFDEQYVLCAMDMLKLGGKFKRDLRGFEDSTRDRLTVLAERLEAHSRVQMEVEEARSGTSKKTSFSLPDSLSIVDIDSVLTEEFCGDDESLDDGMNASVAMLKHLAMVPDDDQSSVLYPKTEEAVQRLANSCHLFIFDVCSAVPMKHLRDMSEMKAWREGTATDTIESYGILPQQYITNVGEHMLALVQAFEPFADDPDSLGIANEIMNGVRDVALKPWNEFVATAGVVGSDSIVYSLMNGKAIGDLVLQNAALTEEDAAFEEGISDAEKASGIFCNAWLDVIGLAVTGKLLERVMRISQLTPKGCEHLAADFNYLINVFSALGVAGHPHPFVSHIAALVILGDAELKEQVGNRNRSDSMQAAMRAVEVRIALLKGISMD